MRRVVTVYCNLPKWADDKADCFDFSNDYETLPPDSFVVAVLTPETEALVPPDIETMTPEQLNSFAKLVDAARRALSQ